MTMFKRLEILAVVSSIAVASPPAMANLVSNPGFEAGFTDWTTNGFFLNIFPGDAHTGSNSAATGCVGHFCVDTQGSGAFVSQTLSTVAGATYSLSFWVGEDAGPTSEFSVFWDGSLIADVLNPANNTLPTPTNSGMIEYSYSGLVATSTSTVLEVHGRQDPAGLDLDDVSVDPVPEPASLALLSSGVIGISLLRRRRK